MAALGGKRTSNYERALLDPGPNWRLARSARVLIRAREHRHVRKHVWDGASAPLPPPVGHGAFHPHPKRTTDEVCPTNSVLHGRFDLYGHGQADQCADRRVDVQVRVACLERDDQGVT